VAVDMTAQHITGEGTDVYSAVEILQGSPRADVFSGDPETRRILEVDGNGGRDLLDLSDAISGQTVYLSSSYELPPGSLWASGIRRIVGSPFRDHFIFSSGELPARFAGGAGRDSLIGGPLDDRLSGGNGDDVLDGKGGADVCNGGPGSDKISHCEQP
jgi:Ca2+-binding RTX toxin-like protein